MVWNGKTKCTSWKGLLPQQKFRAWTHVEKESEKNSKRVTLFPVLCSTLEQASTWKRELVIDISPVEGLATSQLAIRYPAFISSYRGLGFVANRKQKGLPQIDVEFSDKGSILLTCKTILTQEWQSSVYWSLSRWATNTNHCARNRKNEVRTYGFLC